MGRRLEGVPEPGAFTGLPVEVETIVSTCVRKSPAVWKRISGFASRARSTISSRRTSICTLRDGGWSLVAGSSPVSSS